jgi:hypothetical protein
MKRLAEHHKKKTFQEEYKEITSKYLFESSFR